MLDLHAPATDAPASAEPPRNSRHRFALAGIAFEVLIGEGVAWELPAELAEQCVPLRGSYVEQVFADVLVSVRTGLAQRTDIRSLGAQRYAVAAVVEHDENSVADLLRAVACTVVRLARAELSEAEHAGGCPACGARIAGD